MPAIGRINAEINNAVKKFILIDNKFTGKIFSSLNKVTSYFAK
jgi:hypothetical protein